MRRPRNPATPLCVAGLAALALGALTMQAAPVALARPAARATPPVPATAVRSASPVRSATAVRSATPTAAVPDPRTPTTVTVYGPEEERQYGRIHSSQACVKSASGTPQGQVVLYLDARLWAWTVLNAGGCASLYGPIMDRGPHSLMVKYTGSSTHAPSSAGERFTVGKGNIFLQAAVDPPASRVGSVVTVTARFFDPPRAPTGKITVLEEDRTLGSAPLGPSGTASVALKNLPVGTHNLSVVYAGDSWFHHGEEQVTAWVFAGETSPVLLEMAGTVELPLPSGIPAHIDLRTIPPLDGVVGVRLVDTRSGDVLGYSAGTSPHRWSPTRADAVYDLQAQAVDASGKVLHRSPLLRVAWEPPDTTLTASSTSPAAGEPVTLGMEEDLGAGLEDHFVLRILELPDGTDGSDGTGQPSPEGGVDTGLLVAECEPEDGCRAVVERPTGTHRFVGLFVARDTELTIRRSAPVTVTWP
ncbi:MAG: hypothetical protein QG608_191 [Actinomycetota bacterium]|nr:hypothetical protein [Actinomycetota bacterium]